MAKNSSIYQKRGNLNFKERKMIAEINEVLGNKPEMEQGLSPASTFDELKELHYKFTAEPVDFVDVPTSTESAEVTSKQAPIIDPLNRDEPNVRDYVMDDKFDPFADFQKGNQSNFSEPTNFGQAFDLPDEEDMQNNRQSKGNSNNNSRPSQQRPSQQRPQQGFTDDSVKDKRRSKRFAKSIINTTCNLLEVGFVWYATKDINESKLAEYELTEEIDVNALLSLPDGSEVTIKEFFLAQLGDIQEASKISQEEKDDWTDSLTEIFIEKNIQPSPAYEFGMNALSVLAKQGIKLYMIANQNNQILNQLRERNALIKEQNQQQYQQPTPQEPAFTTPPPPREPEAYSEPINDPVDEIMENELSLLDTIQTKE
jgi:predicted Fe-Mo cluster-binding NifX family protein